jgi:hypothetical protein
MAIMPATKAANKPVAPNATDAFKPRASLLAAADADGLEVAAVELAPVELAPVEEVALEEELASLCSPPWTSGGSSLPLTFAAAALKASRVCAPLELLSCQ